MRIGYDETWEGTDDIDQYLYDWVNADEGEEQEDENSESI